VLRVLVAWHHSSLKVYYSVVLSAAGAPYQRANVQELQERAIDSLDMIHRSTRYLGTVEESQHWTAYLDLFLSKSLLPKLAVVPLDHLPDPNLG